MYNSILNEFRHNCSKLIQNFNHTTMIYLHYRKVILLFIIFFMVKTGASQTFNVKGEIKDIYDGSLVILQYFDSTLETSKKDTAITKSGRFKFSGKVSGASGAYITIVSNKENKNSSLFFVIEPSAIIISIKGETYNEIDVNGSVAHQEYKLLKKELWYEEAELKKISDSSSVIDKLLINAQIDDSTAKSMKVAINKNTPSLYNAALQKEIAYMKAHPDSYVSLMSFTYFIGRVSNDSIDVWYTSISNKVKGGSEDKEFLRKYLRYRKAISAEYPFDKLKLHEPAPEFYIYEKSTNDTLKVKDFAGKVVILELWGLSCVPCLYSNLALEKIQRKYKNNEIKIISLAKTFPGDIPGIRSYIKKNKFSDWIHVVLNNDANEDLEFLRPGNFAMYIGLGIPRTIIIDQEGKLVYKSYGYSEAHVEEVENLIDKLIATQTN